MEYLENIIRYFELRGFKVRRRNRVNFKEKVITIKSSIDLEKRDNNLLMTNSNMDRNCRKTINKKIPSLIHSPKKKKTTMLIIIIYHS